MSHRAAGWVLAGATLAVSVLAGGCQSTFSPGSVIARSGSTPAEKAKPLIVLTQDMVVDWQIKPAKADPSLILSGHSVVGPDGKIEMGPYGPCAVAGLTLPKASAALEKHLTRFVTGPKVTITTPSPSPMPDPNDIAWKPAGAPLDSSSKKVFPVVFAQSKDGPPPAESGKDKGVETVPSPRVLVGPESPIASCPTGYAGLAGGAFAAPSEFNPIVLPAYRLGPTDVLQIESLKGLETQPVRGPHLVAPDGTVRVGIYGAVPVNNLTLDEARLRIAETIQARSKDAKIVPTLKDVLDNVSVDVLAYNSKQFFICTDGGGQGEQVIPLPSTGNDFVLSAMSKIQGLPAVASKYRIWVARANGPGGAEPILPVDWIAITQHGAAGLNWQIMPGDRIYVHSDPWIRANVGVSKVLAPFERVMGVILLGSQTVNSIKSGTVGGTR
jgi:polysaccharide biosynthesis/export protein